MRPVNSTNEHKPNEGITGDCFRACVASVLEKNIWEVPHFYSDIEAEYMEVLKCIKEWFQGSGMSYLEMHTQEDPRDFMQDVNPDMYYILLGESKPGVGHAVVAHGNKIVHDPSGTGLMDNCDMWAIGIIGVNELNHG